MTHTPGPWRVSAPPYSEFCVVSDDAHHVLVADCKIDSPLGAPRDQVRANARLLAASPTLRAVCENGIFYVQRVLDSWDNGDLSRAVNELEAWQESASAAVARCKEG